LKKSIFDLSIIAIFTGIIFSVEQVLAFIPNIQLTVFLMILYTRVLGFKKTLFIAVLHTLMDNIYNGTLMVHMVIPMMMGWSLIPILLSTIFKKFESAISLASFAFLFGFIYGIIFIPFASYTFGYPIWLYFLNDLPFEFMMAISGALSVGVLYQPIYIILNKELSYYQLLGDKRYSSI
jgi:hypothetical protein